MRHPNIATVHLVDEDGGVHFITIELVKGKTVSERRFFGGWPSDEATEALHVSTDRQRRDAR